jgi:hypothetical protein
VHLFGYSATTQWWHRLQAEASLSSKCDASQWHTCALIFRVLHVQYFRFCTEWMAGAMLKCPKAIAFGDALHKPALHNCACKPFELVVFRVYAQARAEVRRPDARPSLQAGMWSSVSMPQPQLKSMLCTYTSSWPDLSLWQYKAVTLLSARYYRTSTWW